MKTPPYCELPGHHQARAYTPSEETNIAKTIREHREQHTPPPGRPIGDDYDNVQHNDWLEPGGFK